MILTVWCSFLARNSAGTAVIKRGNVAWSDVELDAADGQVDADD